MKLFKKKPYKVVECGGFVANFYYNENDLENTYLEITTKSGVWSMRVAGNNHAYGYLLAAANQGLTEQIHGYATTCYVVAQTLTTDQGFTDDVLRAISKWQRRMEKKAESEAKKVTATDEQVSQAVMEAVTQEHNSKEFKREVKDALEELRSK